MNLRINPTWISTWIIPRIIHKFFTYWKAGGTHSHLHRAASKNFRNWVLPYRVRNSSSRCCPAKGPQSWTWWHLHSWKARGRCRYCLSVLTLRCKGNHFSPIMEISIPLRAWKHAFFKKYLLKGSSWLRFLWTKLPSGMSAQICAHIHSPHASSMFRYRFAEVIDPTREKTDWFQLFQLFQLFLNGGTCGKDE